MFVSKNLAQKIYYTIEIVLLLLVTSFYKANCQIISSSDLNCNFNNICQWRNATIAGQDDGDFLITDRVFVDFQQISAKHTDIDETFAYTYGSSDGPKRAILISDVISCQLGGATLKLWYYRSDIRTTLEVCIRQPPGNMISLTQSCFPFFVGNHIRQWLYAAVELPPISQPFELLIKATFIQPYEIIAIDNLAYDAILCESISPGLNEGAGGAYGESTYSNIDTAAVKNIHCQDGEIAMQKNTNIKSQYIPRMKNVGSLSIATKYKKFRPLSNDQMTASKRKNCSVVECSFDNGTLCDYAKNPFEEDTDLALGLPIGTVVKGWLLSKKKVGNSLTGILHDASQDGYFAYAGEAQNSRTVYLLSNSHSFSVSEDVILNFKYYLAGKHGRLRVCIDTIRNCPLELSGMNIDLLSRQWKNAKVLIHKGTHLVHFLADRLRKNYAIGIDDIHLLEADSSRQATCYV